MVPGTSFFSAIGERFGAKRHSPKKLKNMIAANTGHRLHSAMVSPIFGKGKKLAATGIIAIEEMAITNTTTAPKGQDKRTKFAFNKTALFVDVKREIDQRHQRLHALRPSIQSQ